MSILHSGDPAIRSRLQHIRCGSSAEFLLRYAVVASAPQHRRVLGQNIRAERTRAGLSQEQLAEKSSLHPVFVGDVERGEENVSMDSLVKIARALKVSVGDLVRGI
jgi:DNA-binding XRE family transcriptional regulator